MIEDVISSGGKVKLIGSVCSLVRPTIPKGTVFEVVRCNPYHKDDDCIAIYNEIYGSMILKSENFEVVKR